MGSLTEGADPVGAKAMTERIWMVRSLLESEDPFPRPGATERWPPLQGLGLPPEVLHKIYHANFERLVAPQPRPLDLTRARQECGRIARISDGENTQAREVANWLATHPRADGDELPQTGESRTGKPAGGLTLTSLAKYEAKLRKNLKHDAEKVLAYQNSTDKQH